MEDLGRKQQLSIELSAKKPEVTLPTPDLSIPVQWRDMIGYPTK